jgi:tRNA-dihydrouridine synthase B
MAGITDLPFRRLVARFGAGLVVSEMVASQEMVQARPGTRDRAELGAGVENTAVQIAGREAHWMAEAARMVEAMGARVIDINMGCPAKKVTNGWSGSALLRDLDHALRLVEAVVGAVKVPVTLKTRLGWDDACLNASDLARGPKRRASRMITDPRPHPLPVLQGPRRLGGHPARRRCATIPVIANGDIVSTDTAPRRCGLGRGGRHGRARRAGPPLAAGADRAAACRTPGAAAARARRWPTWSRALRRHAAFYGATSALRVARKHLGWYMDAAGNPARAAPRRADGAPSGASCRAARWRSTADAEAA